MDNRSYDPDQQPKDPLLPDGSAEQKSSVLGEHHEQPVPVDPLQGIVGDPTTHTGIAPMASSDVVRPSYPEFTQQAIEHQVPHTSNQPTGAAPPYTSAHPAGATPPPSQSPYTPDAYAPGPGQPPLPPQFEEKKGFNWLACCGISCGLVLVLVVIGVFITYRYFKPIINAGMQLSSVAGDVQKTGAPDAADVEVTVDELGANPAQFEGQWVALTGRVEDDPGGPVDSMRQQRGMEQSSAYFIKPNIVVMDMSTAQPVAQQGDTISVIGKPVVLDLEALLGPFAGQIEKDADLEGMKKLVFIVTDKVTVESSAAKAGDTGAEEAAPADDAPSEETPSDA